MYHVNRENQKAKCHAKSMETCPFFDGDSNPNHYATEWEAQEESERRLEEQYGGASLKKPSYEIDHNDIFSPPQADKLNKVSTTVDAVANGATTADSIAVSLNVVDRQGSYYGSAAGHLGFVDVKENTDGVNEYVLTEKGQKFLDSDSQGRSKMIAETVDSMPSMEIYRRDGKEEAQRFLEETYNLSSSTARRRVTTLERWDKDITASGFSRSIEDDKKDGATRFEEAKAKAKKTIESSRKPKESNKKPQQDICEIHFMQKSLTGQCPMCE